MSNNMLLKLGLAGCGHMGFEHLDRLVEHPRVQVVGVSDTVTENRRKAAAVCGAQQFADAGRMMDELDLDAVLIATSTQAHYRLAMEAISRGIDVAVEKPLAVRRDHAWELAGAATAENVKLMCLYHGPLMGKGVRAAIEQIEPVYCIRCEWLRHPEFRFPGRAGNDHKPAAGDPLGRDLFGHLVATSMCLANIEGRAQEVMGRLFREGAPVGTSEREDTFMATVQFPATQFEARISNVAKITADEIVEIVFECKGGRIVVPYPTLSAARRPTLLRTGSKTVEELEPMVDESEARTEQIDRLVRYFLDDVPPPVDGVMAAEIVAVTAGCYDSAEAGGRGHGLPKWTI